jgi:hypothetical protein
MDDLPVGVRCLLTNVPEIELGECPECESDDDEEDPSKGCYANPLVGDDMWTKIADAYDNHEPRDGSDDSDDFHVPPHLRDQDVENHHGLHWKRDGVLEHPVNNMANMWGRLKSEKVHNFAKPLIYFMLIFPLVYWKIISRETNENSKEQLAMQVSKNRRRTISGARWTHDTNYQDIMGFYAILIQIVVFPLPGAIRSVLHFNSNSSETICKDIMHKTRLIFNIPKALVSELSLDEASCESLSNYGREVIFFNPAKNCGKFHFRLYMLCDASTLCCLTLKVATRNDSDPTNPEDTLEIIQQ